MTPEKEEYQCNAIAACPTGLYWNYLACDCFMMAQCMMMCDKDEDLIPTEGCTCVPREEIRALFPDWASPEDVSRSMVEGRDAMDENHHGEEHHDRKHDEDRHHDKHHDRRHDSDDSDDEKIDRFNDALKELELAADDLFNMDSASAVTGLGTIFTAVTLLNN